MKSSQALKLRDPERNLPQKHKAKVINVPKIPKGIIFHPQNFKFNI